MGRGELTGGAGLGRKGSDALSFLNQGGVYVAMVTPLEQSGRIDEAGVSRLVEHVLTGEVDGIVALGSSGEGVALPRAERRRLLRLVVSEVGGRVPVVAGVAQMTAELARRDLAEAAEEGAAAGLVVPPFYFELSQGAVRRFFEDLSDARILPILLYNIPRFTKIRLEPETVAGLALRDNIVGIKDSSRDMEYLQQVARLTADRPAFSVFTGSDSLLLCSLLAGAHGIIGVCPNVVPRLCVELYRTFRQGRWDEARRLQARVTDALLAVRRGDFPAGFKAALELLGICDRWLAHPGQPLNEGELRALGEAMRHAQILE